MSRYWDTALPFFPESELACKCCGLIHLAPSFAALLPALRVAWGGPLSPTSVCRCPRHNNAVGGHHRSLHLTMNRHWPSAGTMAADIAWRSWVDEERLGLARLAWQHGWSVGLHDGFIHIDRRADMNLNKLPQATFLYGQWSGPFTVEDIRE